MGFAINNALDDTLLFGGIGAVLICIGLVYTSNPEVNEPKEQIDYLEERLKQNRYHFTTIVGGSKTRRKKI
jgi:hypothetical protein